MKACAAFFAAAVILLSTLGWAQTAELYQDKPSLLDPEEQVRVTYDAARHTLRFDGISPDPLSPRTPSWGCMGQGRGVVKGTVSISPALVTFRSTRVPYFAIEKRDYRLEKGFQYDFVSFTFYGNSHTCSFDVTKPVWARNLMMHAWLDLPSAVKQFQFLTASLQPGKPAPTAFGAEWGGCRSRAYTGDPMSMNISKPVDIRKYFSLVQEISGLTVTLDPSVTGVFTLVAHDVPWDMTLPILSDRAGLECRLDGKTLYIRKQAGAPPANLGPVSK